MLRVLDIFAGIGGFSLGLHRASKNFNTEAFVECDPFCQAVLRKRFPGTRIYDDVTKFTAEEKSFEVICGGFPCQDISSAGRQAGIEGEQSGLWKEYKRLIEEIRPNYAIIENVANLRSKGLIVVLKDLWSIGYDAEWAVVGASEIGAYHRRDRTWIVAYPAGQGLEGAGKGKKRRKAKRPSPLSRIFFKKKKVTNSSRKRLEIRGPKLERAPLPPLIDTSRYWEEVKPPLCGVGNGFSSGIYKDYNEKRFKDLISNERKSRLKALGNAVVPQIVEIIGRRIIEREDLE